MAGFPSDRRHELTRVMQIDGTVYCEGVFHGTNEGPIVSPEGELPPTGRPLAMRFALVVDIDEAAGHAKAVQLYFDQLDFLGQLGLLPETVA